MKVRQHSVLFEMEVYFSVSIYKGKMISCCRIVFVSIAFYCEYFICRLCESVLCIC